MISRIVPIREIVSLDIQTSNLHKFRYETRLSHQASLKTILRNNPSLEEIKLYADEDSHFTLPELPKLETCELILPDDMMLKDVTYLANTISTVSRLKLVGEDRQIKKKVNKDIPIAERISKLREPIKSNEEVSSAVEKKSEQISPKDNTELPTLYSLKEIEISTKTINLNDLSVFLKRTPNCETLVLNNCQLRFDIPKGCLPTNIKKIVLNYENGRGFTANNCVNSLLSICPQLQELEIKTNTDVSASISDEKHNLQLGALEKLSCVAGNRDITLQILDTASCLQYLELKEFKFEDISVPMPQLKHLKIVSAIGILFFKKLHLFPNISILDLSAACMFDTFMFSLMPQLETLKLPLIDLSFASSAEGGNHLPHIVNACTNIKYLDIGRNVIKKEMISAMSLQRLEVLNLKDAKQLSVNTIEAAIHQFPRLTTIVLPADFDPRRLFQIRPKYPHLHFHCDEKRFAPKAPDAQAGIGLPGTATGGGNLNDILTRERQSRLDADTGGPGSSYVVQQIFYPKQNPLHDPLPNLYRLAAKTFQGIGQDGKPVFAPQYYFEEITVPLKYTTEEIMVDYKQIYARDDKTYLGKLKLDLKYGERHIMFPGLSNDDQLFGVAIDPPIAGHFERCPITRLHRFVRDDLFIKNKF